ncbi:TRAPP subunit BET5 [Aspergillus clavatus NRRL 1]|uniref:Trafficking protein particle complex subunit n=1 Tax=Aspergillus clavatus (strain ATCC 1007 / CBS 513.65 / DSM 816 / NCTC 3887 / NRRL 1 / QM 1276 / 107) TaxID=344612 RepID=A1C9T7_ASPCL|nr:TRAPP complex subunit (Bet5), putative [Aspergillus clavatus NRRL 1]EAW12505.1 TRAPP complex subunit (Bet5), putative [Aspergillus clavatus NRRL 1]
MVVYSFYIFDRHGIQPFLLKRKQTVVNVSVRVLLAECIYKRQWLPRPASIAGKSSRPTSEVATQNGVSSVYGQSARTTDDDAKLIFGTVFSLRNMVRKLGGEDDSFVTYRTSQYKLHYYETPTNIKFVMLTDLKSPSMRIALQQIYINLYVEYAWSLVVKNPLSPVEHPGGVGVNNELFEESLEQFVVCFVGLRTPETDGRLAFTPYIVERQQVF